MTSDKPASAAAIPFASRTTVERVEEGLALAPKFDADGLIPCITTDVNSGEVLMLGHMNGEALQETMATGEAHYWSRSRQCLWRKGTTSGLVQEVVEMRIDDDQDAVWLRVRIAGSGASCHVGYRSCFYRSVEPGGHSGGPTRLVFTESQKSFDPKAVYDDAPNFHASRPTQSPNMRASHSSALRSCTLHVCTSCRAPGSPCEPRESRAGFRLHEELRATLRESPCGSHVEVRPAACLSMCRRPCGSRSRRPGLGLTSSEISTRARAHETSLSVSRSTSAPRTGSCRGSDVRSPSAQAYWDGCHHSRWGADVSSQGHASIQPGRRVERLGRAHCGLVRCSACVDER